MNNKQIKDLLKDIIDKITEESNKVYTRKNSLEIVTNVYNLMEKFCEIIEDNHICDLGDYKNIISRLCADLHYVFLPYSMFQDLLEFSDENIKHVGNVNDEKNMYYGDFNNIKNISTYYNVGECPRYALKGVKEIGKIMKTIINNI